MGGCKDKVVSHFKTDILEDYSQQAVHGSGKKASILKKQKQCEDSLFKNIRNLFRIEKENKAINDIIIRDIKTLFEQQEEDYYNSTRIGNFWNNNFIEYESNGDKNKKNTLTKLNPT